MTDATSHTAQKAPTRWKRSESSRLRDNERRLASWRAAHIKAPWKELFRRASQRAISLGVPFCLTEEWAKARWTGKCEVTGIEFKFDGGYAMQFSPSVDRIEPEKGYVPDNCRFVLYAVNVFKGAGTDETMRRIAMAIVAN